MSTTTTNNAANEVLKPVNFDLKKAMAQRLTAVKIGENIDRQLSTLTAPIMPTFGGAEVVTCLAIIQTFQGIVRKAEYEKGSHYVSYVKGGTKVYEPLKDNDGKTIVSEHSGNPLFSLSIKDGKQAFKFDRYKIAEAEKGTVTHKILVDFAASDVATFSKTLGEALQVAEANIFSKLVNGVKVLKNSRAALTIALQIGDQVVSTSFIANNAIEAKYLNPATYAGKTDKEQREIWNLFCSNVYQALKVALTAGQTLKLNDSYLQLMGLKK